METQLRRPAISKKKIKIRAVRPELGAEATLLSLLSYFFQKLSRIFGEIKKLLLN